MRLQSLTQRVLLLVRMPACLPHGQATLLAYSCMHEYILNFFLYNLNFKSLLLLPSCKTCPTQRSGFLQLGCILCQRDTMPSLLVGKCAAARICLVATVSLSVKRVSH